MESPVTGLEKYLDWSKFVIDYEKTIVFSKERWREKEWKENKRIIHFQTNKMEKL